MGYFILLHSIHTQYSSTGNPDIVPEKEKKEMAGHHTESCSMWTPESENKHTAYHSLRGSVDDPILIAAVMLVLSPSTEIIIDPLPDNLACRSTVRLWVIWWQLPRLQPFNIALTRKIPFHWTIDRPVSRGGGVWPDWVVCEGYQRWATALCIPLSWGDGRGRLL